MFFKSAAWGLLHGSGQSSRASVRRLQAALGGNPSRLGQVHAFLRVKNQDVSTSLDFDSPTGTDTSWQRIFCCLRSGFIAEAVEVRSAPRALQQTDFSSRSLASTINGHRCHAFIPALDVN